MSLGNQPPLSSTPSTNLFGSKQPPLSSTSSTNLFGSYGVRTPIEVNSSKEYTSRDIFARSDNHVSPSKSSNIFGRE